MSAGLTLAVLLAAGAGVIAIAYAVSYNRLIANRQEVADAWAAIDAELQRRHELVPRLIASVQAAADHEQTLLTELAQRNAAASGSAGDAASATRWEPPLAVAICQVIALRERYPKLNSQQNFLDLQQQLATTEDRIAAARRYYNMQVAQLNTRVAAFPSTIVARRHAITEADHYDPS
jgi:LemA protein